MKFKSKDELHMNNFVKLIKSYLGRIDCPNLILQEKEDFVILKEKDSTVLLLYAGGMVVRLGEYDFMNNYTHHHEFEWLINEVCRYFEPIKNLKVESLDSHYSKISDYNTLVTAKENEFFFFSIDFEENMRVIFSYMEKYLK